jgi:hypothetical protein
MLLLNARTERKVIFCVHVVNIWVDFRNILICVSLRSLHQQDYLYFSSKSTVNVLWFVNISDTGCGRYSFISYFFFSIACSAVAGWDVRCGAFFEKQPHFLQFNPNNNVKFPYVKINIFLFLRG